MSSRLIPTAWQRRSSRRQAPRRALWHLLGHAQPQQLRIARSIAARWMAVRSEAGTSQESQWGRRSAMDLTAFPIGEYSTSTFRAARRETSTTAALITPQERTNF